jgi:hypothetical protein
LQPALLGVVFLSLYAPVLSHLASDWWQDPDYSHRFLIPWLSAYFAWQRRATLWVAVPQPNPWGISLLLMGLVLLCLGRMGAELFLTQVPMIIVLGTLVHDQATFLGMTRCASRAHP